MPEILPQPSHLDLFLGQYNCSLPFMRAVGITCALLFHEILRDESLAWSIDVPGHFDGATAAFCTTGVSIETIRRHFLRQRRARFFKCVSLQLLPFPWHRVCHVLFVCLSVFMHACVFWTRARPSVELCGCTLFLLVCHQGLRTHVWRTPPKVEALMQHKVEKSTTTTRENRVYFFFFFAERKQKLFKLSHAFFKLWSTYLWVLQMS